MSAWSLESFMRRAAVALVVVLPLTACGSESGADDGSTADSFGAVQDMPVMEEALSASEVNEMIAVVATCDPGQWQRLEFFRDQHREDRRFDINEFWNWATKEWVACPDRQTRMQVAQSPGIPYNALIELFQDEDPRVLSALEANEPGYAWGLKQLARDEDESIRLLAARFSKTDPEVLEPLVRDSSAGVRDAAIQNFLKHPSLCGINIDFDSYFGRYTEKSGSWWEGETTTGRLLIAVPEIADADSCRLTLLFPGDPEPIQGQWKQTGLTLNVEVDSPELRSLSGSVRDNVLRLELGGEAFAKLVPQPISGRETSPDEEETS